jgi:hypothetical protein
MSTENLYYILWANWYFIAEEFYLLRYGTIWYIKLN